MLPVAGCAARCQPHQRDPCCSGTTWGSTFHRRATDPLDLPLSQSLLTGRASLFLGGFLSGRVGHT